MSNTRIWGYARVSTMEQNEARQIKALKEAGIEEKNIIIDKASGKSFERVGYQYLKTQLLREGDTLVIMSIDRLGRNYNAIKDEWRILNNELRVGVKVLDMPLLDTTQDTANLDRQFLSDLVLQILSYVADKERANIKRRQRQGIDAMPIGEDGKRVSIKNGRTYGRKPADFSPEWIAEYQLWKSGQKTAVQAFTSLGMSKSSFYRITRNYEGKKGSVSTTP